MARLAITFGSILILLGVGAFVGKSIADGAPTSLTAMIPAILGVLLAGCGLLARKKAMLGGHLAALVALLGLGGTIPGLIKLMQWMGGTAPERQLAVVIQSITAVLCAIFLALAIRSFIAARRGKTASA